MYRTVSHLSEYTDICQDEVRRKIKAMQSSGAYPQAVFLTNPVRVEVAAFIHFNTYQKLIIEGIPFPKWEEA